MATATLRKMGEGDRWPGRIVARVPIDEARKAGLPNVELHARNGVTYSRIFHTYPEAILALDAYGVTCEIDGCDGAAE